MDGYEIIEVGEKSKPDLLMYKKLRPVEDRVNFQGVGQLQHLRPINQSVTLQYYPD